MQQFNHDFTLKFKLEMIQPRKAARFNNEKGYKPELWYYLSAEIGSFEVSGQTSSFSTYRVRPNNRTPSHYDRGRCLNAPRLKQWCQLIELDCFGNSVYGCLPAVPLIELD